MIYLVLDGMSRGLAFKNNDTYSLYECVKGFLSESGLSDEEAHIEASNAQGWSELACYGEQYEGEGFTILKEEAF